jgi:hypothetical protein
MLTQHVRTFFGVQYFRKCVCDIYIVPIVPKERVRSKADGASCTKKGAEIGAKNPQNCQMSQLLSCHATSQLVPFARYDVLVFHKTTPNKCIGYWPAYAKAKNSPVVCMQLRRVV